MTDIVNGYNETTSYLDAEIAVFKEYCKEWNILYTVCVEDSIRTLYGYLSEQDISITDDNIEIYNDSCVYEITLYSDDPSYPMYSMEPQIEKVYKFESELLNNCVWKAIIHFHKKINE